MSSRQGSDATGGNDDCKDVDISENDDQKQTKVDDVDPSKVLPLRMTSVVVKGYGRGSTDLGIPTANLDREAGMYGSASGGNKSSSDAEAAAVHTFEDLPTGIYWGFCRIGNNVGDPSTVYKTACSIGYNPYYGNKQKTVEPHMIAPPESTRRHLSSCGETLLVDFYDQPIRLSLVGYLRPELPFEGLEKLVEAIKNDIVTSERLCDGQDETTLQERAWVMSDEPVE
jgi:FAD synthase